jgi:hypothetical protein
MNLPPAFLTEQPTIEQFELASAGHMVYKKIFTNGKLVGWKLYHAKEKRSCGC